VSDQSAGDGVEMTLRELPENGYDESSFNIKGQFWYVWLKKRF
jgi:hypothetical protein